MKTIGFKSNSPAQTKRFGEKIGRALKAGDVVALVGKLGAGKTTLAKGIAKGLGVPDEADVLSPSFVLIHEYEGREKIYHIDWYRLKSVEGPDELLAAECFDSDAVTLVEWAERGRGLFPRDHLRVDLTHKGPRSRLIKVSAKGKAYENFGL
ncbi:MAG: tRNA (adenosine(37)-N6)-threonylcarbamoyltransferase complex ATPase subunit type 1 TsaE [Candidatus Omnitrophota bacterium]